VSGNRNTLDTRAAAEHLGLAESTLEKLRVTGGGPVFCKLGRRVVYRLADLDVWIASRRVGSTSERN
jgi:predicted DNA-binding transcriptional regulator AlpA